MVVRFGLLVINLIMDTIHIIKTALMANYNPAQIEIIDESYKHAGHAGFGEYSHLLVRISATPFKDLSRVERNRKLTKDVFNAIGKEIHSVSFEFLN
jgi:BolA protein